jgi:hypothetical protein
VCACLFGFNQTSTMANWTRSEFDLLHSLYAEAPATLTTRMSIFAWVVSEFRSRSPNSSSSTTSPRTSTAVKRMLSRLLSTHIIAKRTGLVGQRRPRSKPLPSQVHWSAEDDHVLLDGYERQELSVDSLYYLFAGRYTEHAIRTRLLQLIGEGKTVALRYHKSPIVAYQIENTLTARTMVDLAVKPEARP